MDQRVIEARLFAHAQYRASELGFVFAPDCFELVRNLARRGAEQMGAEGALDDAKAIALAEENFSKFILAMVDEANLLGYAELHENTFGAAMSLCPLWPFC